MNIGNNEVWRAIDGYLNYEVSSHGRVRNNNTGTIFKQRIDNLGYDRVDLCKNGKATTIRIHRLVCAAFNENDNNYNVVDHIDRNKLNNFYENLRWVSYETNRKNASIRTDNSSGITGVFFCNTTNRWIARWSVNKNKHRKAFINKEDAINYRKEMEAINGYL